MNKKRGFDYGRKGKITDSVLDSLVNHGTADVQRLVLAGG